MEKWLMRTNEVFLDTSCVIALASPNDRHHEQAKVIANQLEKRKSRLITTRAVMLEIGNALSKQRYRQVATELLKLIEADPDVEIIPLSEELYIRAFQLYQGRLDKEWGLTDCISFTVMQDYGLVEALTTDEHFHQLGFQALLLTKGHFG